ncbi:hypothetical protein LUX29_21225 [Aureimonas altamirensis]|uniref:hypothetical protein n=1 Tax=Aureimonas altamirensis TaxID=370622 RepID=UPI001E553E59|nr:hypothetical protein [Aureimonas altamirensis]UHD45478.1 hypothetical protein LUX29_21225 [Aureimonas altamirensis]
MRDRDVGKLMVEEMHLESFVDAFPLVTGRVIEITDRGESPDFEALIEGEPIGIELTEIRDLDDAGDYLAEVYRIASKKSASYAKHGHFDARPIILVCHSDALPFHDFRGQLEAQAYWDDFDNLGFAEIWLMDLSDAYYSAQDPRRPADLFGLKPEAWRGFQRYGSYDRKPFG